MLFNSFDFLFGFLPICLAGHHLVRRGLGVRASWVWLTLASLVYYAWWYVPYLALLLGSMVGNFVVGRLVADTARSEEARKRWLTLGVAVNLALLGWFKYAGFFDETIASLTGLQLGLPQVTLPLAISFFTFQQIAYLVDARRGKAEAHDFLDYALFVAFFPQLIAGPIVHHAEILPQFRAAAPITRSDRSVGLVLLIIGLAKKVWIADTLAPVADVVFQTVNQGESISTLQAWAGVSAFFFQIYFDFSGYSDMATGLARFFGIRLPVNFDAPYRSASIIEHWERWHVTLSRFLRDYLYIPLGGNRKGDVRRRVNLVLTMLLGGLWHGAAWTYVAWGGLNGAYLIINQMWRSYHGGPVTSRGGLLAAKTLTLLAHVPAYVFFRSASFADAWVVLGALIGRTSAGLGQLPPWVVWSLLGTFAITQLAPTTQRWLEAFEPVIHQGRDTLRWSPRFTWKPTAVWAILLGLLGVACLPALERANAFIYWAF